MSYRHLLAPLLVALALAGTPLFAQGPEPQAVGEVTIPESIYAKFPRVAVSGGAVYVAANSSREHATLWSRAAEGDSFGAAQRLGRAEGHPDYSTASVAAAPDGRLVYVWINQPQRAIFARVRAADGAWGPARTVYAGSPFPVYVAVAASDREFIAVWRDPDRPVVFSRSSDGGTTWSLPAALSARAGVNAPAVAAGTDGTVAVAYTQEEGGRLQVFAGVWNGRSFETRRISSASGDFADPGVSVGAGGRVVVSYRGVAESGPASGVFYAARQADGGWPVARLIAGKAIGPVSAAADPAGGTSLFWIGAAQGRSQLWYSRLPAGGAWTAPAAGQATSDSVFFNAHGAIALANDGRLYAHGVGEYFVGDRTYARAYRFLAGAMAGGVVSAQPMIANGESHARAGSLSVSFREVRGAPAELRWRWGAAPTDADPWQPFGEHVIVPAPDGALAGCAEHRLFTQVRSGESAQQGAASDSIIIDAGVQARLAHLGEASAPGFTNRTSATLHVDGSGDCSGLVTARSFAAVASTAVSENVFALTVPIDAVEQPQLTGVELVDAAGNTATLTTTITYDRTAPALEPGAALQASADPDATILATLRLSNVRYSDASGNHPWALAVAVSRAGAEAGDPALAWRLYSLESDAIGAGPDGTLTLDAEISLADLVVRDELTPGSYHFHVRLVDHAGNLGADALAASVELAQVTFPRLSIPLLAR